MYYILLLKDLIEITFYSFLIYSLCIWLKTDTTKNLLPYFFGYCSLLIAAWTVQLPTLTLFLWNYAPIAVIIGIILHEKTLQRNLVTLCSLTPAQQSHENWLDTVLSATFLLMNNNKSVTIIIENNEALEHFLVTPFLINATLSKDLLHILLTTHAYDQYKMVRITKNGVVRGINSSWFTEETDKNTLTLFDKQNALFYTLQSDALILHANPIKRVFTAVHHGKEYDSIAPHNIHSVLTKLLSVVQSPSTKRYSNETTSLKNTPVS